MGNSGSLSTKVYMTTSGAPISSNPGSLTRDYWWHLSVGFDGTTYRFYAAGTLQYSTTTASNLTNSGLKLRIQCATNQDGDNNYYDDLILYQNKNIRTANFTPPTSAWT
jgi:hypothetical protein